MRRIAIFALLAAAPSTAQNTFRGNNAHTGVYQGAGPKQLGGVKWAFKAGGPIVTSPAIADGVVYFGAMDGHLHAVVQDTGQEKWK
ncbi:MAG: pyrrolo-quinoline quinone, partial [Deltaproteobacteria bacterium]